MLQLAIAKFDEILARYGEFLGLPLSLLLSTKTTATKQESNSLNPTPLSINDESNFPPQTQPELTHGHPQKRLMQGLSIVKRKKKRV